MHTRFTHTVQNTHAHSEHSDTDYTLATKHTGRHRTAHTTQAHHAHPPTLNHAQLEAHRTRTLATCRPLVTYQVDHLVELLRDDHGLAACRRQLLLLLFWLRRHVGLGCGGQRQDGGRGGMSHTLNAEREGTGERWGR